MKLVFLDRDGVINKFPGNGNYVTRAKDFHFIPGSLEAIQRLTQAGYKIVVISNQAGIEKGVYSQNKLSQITIKMFREVERAGGKIDRVYYAIARGGQHCDYRKPGIGFIREALRSMNKNLRSAGKTYFVGDTETDILAGHNAGCKTIFVLSGREDRRYMRKWKVHPDTITKDLLEAVKVILDGNGKPAPRKKTSRPLLTARKPVKFAKRK